mgnify:FL=1
MLFRSRGELDDLDVGVRFGERVESVGLARVASAGEDEILRLLGERGDESESDATVRAGDFTNGKVRSW